MQVVRAAQLPGRRSGLDGEAAITVDACQITATYPVICSGKLTPSPRKGSGCPRPTRPTNRRPWKRSSSNCSTLATTKCPTTKLAVSCGTPGQRSTKLHLAALPILLQQVEPVLRGQPIRLPVVQPVELRLLLQDRNTTMTALRLPWMACGHAARSIISKRSMYTSAPCLGELPGCRFGNLAVDDVADPRGEIHLRVASDLRSRPSRVCHRLRAFRRPLRAPRPREPSLHRVLPQSWGALKRSNNSKAAWTQC